MEEPQKPYDATKPTPPRQFEAEVPGPSGNAQIIRSPQDAVAALGSSPQGNQRAEPSRGPLRLALPLSLFFITCYTTFWAGADNWNPTLNFSANLSSVQFQQGMTYMLAVIGILLLHEMGHYLQTLRHHIPASLPMFIPMPLSPFGTMGAVISMDGVRADRKQLFDIGISGPIAGLFLAVPICWYGVVIAEVLPAGRIEAWQPSYPLLIQEMVRFLRPELSENVVLAKNPYLIAGWVGLLITGLNMLPISQLDGGHVIYALFRKRAHLIARAFLIASMLYVLSVEEPFGIVMLILVILIGVDHPPTSNDQVDLGPLRWTIGVTSLVIPILCFSPRVIILS